MDEPIRNLESREVTLEELEQELEFDQVMQRVNRLLGTVYEVEIYTEDPITKLEMAKARENRAETRQGAERKGQYENILELARYLEYTDDKPVIDFR